MPTLTGVPLQNTSNLETSRMGERDLRVEL